ncbi:hypothetical protein CR513_62117, partial [Mucuna pruriens]
MRSYDERKIEETTRRSASKDKDVKEPRRLKPKPKPNHKLCKEFIASRPSLFHVCRKHFTQEDPRELSNPISSTKTLMKPKEDFSKWQTRMIEDAKKVHTNPRPK